MRHRILTTCCVLLLACGGKDGAVGPTGPQGPQGPAGPGTSTILTAVVGSTGSAGVTLPAGAGSNPARPPALSCYLTDNPTTGIWLKVADGDSTAAAYCALALSGGVWTARMLQAPVGWTAAFVVVY